MRLEGVSRRRDGMEKSRPTGRGFSSGRQIRAVEEGELLASSDDVLHIVIG
jgi:hypothetical protein